jgi:hypothetical protein
MRFSTIPFDCGSFAWTEIRCETAMRRESYVVRGLPEGRRRRECGDPDRRRPAGTAVADGLCSRWSTDVYDREVERYGGPCGINVAESIFAVDAVAAVDLVAALRSNEQVDPVELLALTVEDLLASLGLDDTARARWFAARPAPSRQSGQVYRNRQARLRELLAGGASALGPAGVAVAEVLNTRRVALAPLAEDLQALADAGKVCVPVPDLAGEPHTANNDTLPVRSLPSCCRPCPGTSRTATRAGRSPHLR